LGSPSQAARRAEGRSSAVAQPVGLVCLMIAAAGRGRGSSLGPAGGLDVQAVGEGKPVAVQPLVTGGVLPEEIPRDPPLLPRVLPVSKGFLGDQRQTRRPLRGPDGGVDFGHQLLVVTQGAPQGAPRQPAAKRPVGREVLAVDAGGFRVGQHHDVPAAFDPRPQQTGSADVDLPGAVLTVVPEGGQVDQHAPDEGDPLRKLGGLRGHDAGVEVRVQRLDLASQPGSQPHQLVHRGALDPPVATPLGRAAGGHETVAVGRVDGPQPVGVGFLLVEADEKPGTRVVVQSGHLIKQW